MLSAGRARPARGEKRPRDDVGALAKRGGEKKKSRSGSADVDGDFLLISGEERAAGKENKNKKEEEEGKKGKKSPNPGNLC